MRALGSLMLLLASTWLFGGCRPVVSESASAESVVDRTTSPVSPAATSPATAAGPLALRWNELDVGIPPDSVFQPWMMKTSIKSLEGRPARITGYMHGGLAQTTGVREFVLLRDIDCPFGRDGEAHHAILIELQGRLRTDFTRQAVTVEGVFHVRPYTGPDGKTWALYFLEGTAIQVGDQASDNASTEGSSASE